MFTSTEKYLGLTLKDRYRLERFLGEGLRGLAFLAYDSLLEGWVVVKIIKDEIEGFPVPIGEEWTDEPKKAMQVRSHPYIAAILDLGDEVVIQGGEKTRVPYIVWEYINGTSLDELLASGEKISLSELVRMARQFCHTLLFLKEKKLSHGDLHPRNVMTLRLTGGEETIKLIDFGMARNVLTAKARHDDITGTMKILNQLVDKLLADGLTQEDVAGSSLLRDLVRRASNLLPVGKMTLDEFTEGIEELMQYCLGSVDGTSIPGGFRQSRAAGGSFGPLPDFFGRREEVKTIIETAGKAFSHRFTRRVLLLGDPGSGKTAALRKVEDELVRSSDAVVLSHTVNTSDHTKPFSSLSGFWLGLIATSNGKSHLETILDEFPHVLPHFQARLPGLLSLFSKDRLRGGSGLLLKDLSVELGNLIRDAAKLIPIAIIFDDLHGVDLETLRWLFSFNSGEAGHSLACIFAFSSCELNFLPAGENHPLKRLTDDEYTTVVELKPLSYEHLEGLISSEFTFADSSEYSKFAELVMDESGGEPYCVAEIIKECVAKSFIVEDPYGRWQIKKEMDGFVLPASVEAHVARRLMRLNQTEIGLIKWAAYFGPEFPAEGLRAVSGMDDGEFSKTLSSLAEHHHLIRCKDENIWIFAQPTIRKCLLKGIPFSEKRSGLETVTAWQVERAKMLINPVFLSEVAENLYFLGQDRQAGGFAVAAARGHLKSLEYERALAAAELALSPPGGESGTSPSKIVQVISLRVKLEASINLARFDDALSTSERLTALADEMGEIDLKLKVLMRRILAMRLKCDYPAAEEEVHGLIKLARKHDKAKLEGEALRELGTVRYLKGEFEEAIDSFQHSAKVLDKVREVHSAAKTYNNLGLVYKQMGDYAPMEECLRTAIAKSRSRGQDRGEVAIGEFGAVPQQVGRFDEAKRCFEDVISQLKPGENPAFEAKARLSLAQVKTAIGKPDEAAAMAEQALSAFTEMNDKQGQAETMSLLGDIAIDDGNYNLAKEYHKRSLKVKEEIGNEMGICHSKLRLARVAMNEAKFDIALSLSREVTERARKKGWTKLTIEAITGTIRALSECDGSGAALKVLRENRAYEGMVGDPAMVLLDFNLAAAQTYFANGLVNEALRHLNAFEEYFSRVLNSIANQDVRDGFASRMERQVSIAVELREQIGENVES